MATSPYEWISITAEEATAMRTTATAATLGEEAFKLIAWVGPVIYGGAKAPKKVVLETLSKSINIFLEGDRTLYPLENYLKFIETLPKSIREEVSLLFQEKNTPKPPSEGVETSVGSLITTSDQKQRPFNAPLHEKKLKPAQIGLGLDFDFSGDYAACPLDHPGMKINSTQRGDIATKKFYYEQLIDALTQGQGIEPENIYAYTASARQDLHSECQNYKLFGTYSFIAFKPWLEARGFTFIPLLYRDIQKMDESESCYDPSWYIGRSMDEIIAYIFENADLLEKTTLKDVKGNNLQPKLDIISPEAANNKSSTLEEQLKHFAKHMPKDGKVRPFYFIDDHGWKISDVCGHFASHSEKIPEGVELHVIYDAQGTLNNLGFFCYGTTFSSTNSIFSNKGGRHPSLKEAGLLDSIRKLKYSPEKTPVEETKKVSVKEPTTLDSKDSVPEKSDPFIYAGQKDWQKVRELLESGKFGVNDQDKASGSLSTLLHYAVGQGNLEVVQKLVERGRADVNPINQQKKTPLDHCDRSKHPEIEKYLLSNGAKKAKDLLLPEEVKRTTPISPPPNLKDQKPELSIFKEALAGNWQAVEDALKSGQMDVNATNIGSMRLLHYAVGYRNLDAVKMLVGRGADVNLKNDQNKTPLDSCTTSEQVTIKQFLEEQVAKPDGAINDSKQNSKTASSLSEVDSSSTPSILFRIAGKRDWKQVKNLLGNGKYNINHEEFSGTLLHEAVKQGDLEAVKMLVGKGADMNSKNYEHQTPLDCSSKHPAIEKYLLSKGAKKAKDLLPTSPEEVKTVQSANKDSCYKSFFRFWADRTPAEKAAIEVVALAAVEGVACLCPL